MLHNEASNNFCRCVVLLEFAAGVGEMHTGLYRILILASQGKGLSEITLLKEY